MASDFAIRSIHETDAGLFGNAPNRLEKNNVGNRAAPESNAAKKEQPNVEKLKEALAEQDISLQFTRDEETKAVVVKLVNQQTGEQIRQIPSETSLKLAAELGKLQGLILTLQA